LARLEQMHLSNSIIFETWEVLAEEKKCIGIIAKKLVGRV
jgi:hypothetical protein